MARGKKWTQEDVDMLQLMRKRGVPTEAIAQTLQRTEDAINSMEWKMNNLEGTKLKATSEIKRTSNRLLPLDGEKLRYTLREKGISQRGIAEQVGVGRKTVAYWLNTNYIPRIAMTGITNLYGIQYEDVKPESKEKPKKVTEENKKQEEKDRPTHHAQEVTLSNEDSAALYDLIFKAVYEGVKKALNE
jgi:transcriptional regulator with XRE-family HTH domain